MHTLADAARDFLAQPRIAIVGVSRDPQQPANFVFRKLRAAGREVFPVNHAAAEVEGVPCFPNLKSIPGGVQAVVVFTPPAAAEGIVRECAELGLTRVWLHRSFGAGSSSIAAERLAKEEGITLIPAGCPAMFCEPVDIAHRCFRWMLTLTGRLPRHLAGEGSGTTRPPG